MFAAVGLCPETNAGAPDVSAKAAVLIEADSGRLIFGKNENARLSMASTTKIMTALLLLQNCRPDQTIDVTPEMIAVEGSSMGLAAGDRVNRDALLYGMLLSSGNDAANAAAYMVSGGKDEFVSLMNKTAADMGCKDTSFETPSGLDGENHYSTAADMARIAQAAMQNDDFAFAAEQRQATVTFGEPPTSRTLKNHNRLLSLYDGCCGIKTGFTKKSGRCLVSCAVRGGVKLICVTLNAPDDWDDHMKLYDYGFSLLERYTPESDVLPGTIAVTGGEAEFVPVEHSLPALTLNRGDGKRMIIKVYAPGFLYAPVKYGQVIGHAEYVLDGETIAELTLTAGDDVDIRKSEKKPSLWQGIGDFFARLFG